MFQLNMDNRSELPEAVVRTRRMAVVCGLLGCILMTISIVGLLS